MAKPMISAGVGARPTTRYARSGDYSIAYQVVGDAPLDLVLVRGAPHGSRDDRR